MVNIQFPTAEIRRGKKKEERRRNRMKIYMVSLFHRATINNLHELSIFIFNVLFIAHANNTASNRIYCIQVKS